MATDGLEIRVSLHYPGPDAAIARAARGASPG
jgi:hypothetical protein